LVSKYSKLHCSHSEIYIYSYPRIVILNKEKSCTCSRLLVAYSKTACCSLLWYHCTSGHHGSLLNLKTVHGANPQLLYSINNQHLVIRISNWLELSNSCDLLIIMIVSNSWDNDSMQSYYNDISKHTPQRICNSSNMILLQLRKLSTSNLQL